METDNLEEGQNISFDARQGRVKLLLYWLTQLSVAQANAEHSKWVQSLNSLHTLCMAYVPEDERKKVREAIRSAENMVALYSKNKISQTLLIKSLEKANEECLIIYKDQFMTTTSKEEGEFDPTKFDGD